MFPEFLREAGYCCSNNSKEDYNLPKTGRTWDDSSAKAHWKNRPGFSPMAVPCARALNYDYQCRRN
jgi:uncharacterized sulfatase